LKYIREIHIIDPWKHLNKTEQIIGRGIRFCSHTLLPPEERNKAIHKYGDFSLMNQRFNTSKSSTMQDRLIKDPEEFYLYHTLYREARETWTEIPYKVFAEQLNKRPDWIIGDFGCGEAELSKLIRNIRINT
jgi:hypothetical protein